MKILKKIIHILSIISYFLIGIYILIMIPITIGFHPLIVLSGSMEPTLKVGSIVYYHKVDEDKLKVGDIITYKLNDNFISHRISKIENNYFTTKGDANEVNDKNKITYNNIVGKVSLFCIPFLGYYVNYFKNNLHILIILITILIVEFVLRNIKEDNNEKRS